MEEWIDRAEALARLGIRQQTLYAYVSRGRIGVRSDSSDPRKSVYSVEDIETLRARRSRGRGRAAIADSTMAWGEPALETAISTVHRGRLIYRGQDAAVLARTATWEEAAELLWQSGRPIVLGRQRRNVGDAFAALGAVVATSYPSLGRTADRLWADGEAVVTILADGFGAAPIDGLLHERLTVGWSASEEAGQALRRALVLLADHELNASTFATRVAASTGASIAACVLAGLSALSGPRHGGAGAAAIAVLDDARRRGIGLAVRQHLTTQRYIPGFGHPLYPSGDPRAAALLEKLPHDPFIDALRAEVADVTGLGPNIDFALAAFTRWSGLPDDTPFRLFALGRSCGWIAHAVEQVINGALIRPRAHYRGVLPN